jgi:hypothetical protein
MLSGTPGRPRYPPTRKRQPGRPLQPLPGPGVSDHKAQVPDRRPCHQRTTFAGRPSPSVPGITRAQRAHRDPPPARAAGLKPKTPPAASVRRRPWNRRRCTPTVVRLRRQSGARTAFGHERKHFAFTRREPDQSARSPAGAYELAHHLGILCGAAGRHACERLDELRYVGDAVLRQGLPADPGPVAQVRSPGQRVHDPRISTPIAR